MTEADIEFKKAGGLHLHECADVVPATLQNSLMARLDRMSLVKPVAQLAALLGRGFTLQLLSAVAPRSWQTNRDSHRSSDRSRDHSTEPGSLRLLPIQTCPAAGRCISVAVEDYQARLPRPGCSVIVEQFPEMAEAQPEIVAHHFTEAGIVERAIEYWLKAGQRATRLSSNLDSIAHFERGLGLLGSLEDTTLRARTEYRFCLALLTPLIAAKGYTAPELERIFERALRLGEEIGYTEEIFPACTAGKSSNSPAVSSTAPRSTPGGARTRFTQPGLGFSLRSPAGCSRPQVVPRRIGHRL